MLEDTKKIEKLELAMKYEKSGSYDGAYVLYGDLLKENPDYKPALLGLASVSFRLNKIEEAITNYEKLAALSNDYLVWYNIGCIYYKQQKYKEAIISLERSRGVNSNFVSSLVIMALSYGRLKNITAAKETFSKVLEIDPQNEISLTSLAVMHYENGEYEETLELVDKVLKLNNNNHHIRKLRVKLLSVLKRTEESAAEMKQLANSYEAFTEYNEYVKSIPEQIFSDKYGTIDAKIDKLKNKEQSGADDLIALSLCCLLKGESDEAIDYLYKARESALK